MGSASLKCTTSTSWSGSQPTCEAITCPALSAPTNGGRSYSNARFYSSVATFSCDQGYALTASGTLTCGANGAWSGTAPTCAAQSCGNADGASGIVAISYSPNKLVGATATYSCVAGYERAGGTRTRSCQTDLNWSGSAMTCRGVSCSDAPAAPSDGSVAFPSGSRYPAKAVFSCDPGHELRGAAELACSTAGAYVGAAPTCAACGVDEFKAGTASGARCSGCPAHSTTNGATGQASCACRPGYGGHPHQAGGCARCAVGTFRAGVGNGPCQACDTGYTTLGEGATACIGVQCPALAPPAAGGVSVAPSNRRYPDAVATFTCSAGFARQGPATLTCDADGGWSAAAPRCQSICGDGLHVAGEGCDDGNTRDGDGCSADCQREPGYFCADPNAPCRLCELDTLPADRTVDCANRESELSSWLAGAGAAVAVDHPQCGAAAISHEANGAAVGPSPDCAARAYTFTAVFAAQDATDVAVATFTTRDNDRPTLQNLPDGGVVECNAVPSPTVSAADNCDDAPSIMASEVVSDQTCPGTFTLARTYRAEDACGNAAERTVVFDVRDTTAPEFTTAPRDLALECDGAGNVDAVADWLASAGGGAARDACEGEVSITHDVAPEDVAPARLAAGCRAGGGGVRVSATFTAVDGCGNTATATATLTVEDTRAPVLSGAPADAGVGCDAVPPPADVRAADACDTALPSPTLTEKRVDGACPYTYTLTRTWATTDACGHTAEAQQTLSVVDTTEPQLTAEATPREFECDLAQPGGMVALVEAYVREARMGAAADDACAGNGTDLLWTDDLAAQREALLRGACGNTGAATVTLTVADPCGNTATSSARLAVRDSRPPTLRGVPADATVECDAVPPAEPDAVTAADACMVAGPVVALEEVREAGACAHSYSLRRHFTAADDCGNEAEAEQALTVVDTTPPQLQAPPPAGGTQVECDGSGNAADLAAWLASAGGSTVTDNCAAADALQLAHGDVATRRSAGCAATFEVDALDFEVRDACGNALDLTASFAAVDTQPPVLAAPPADLVLECDAQLPEAPAALDATDVCGGAEGTVVTFSEQEVDEPARACAEYYSLERTWTAEDACGLQSSVTQTITVRDTRAPTFTQPPQDLVLECQPAAVPGEESTAAALERWLADNGGALASDGCTPAADLRWSHRLVGDDDLYANHAFGCGRNAAANVTFVVSDACGNEATAVATVRTVDTTPPTLTRLPAPRTVECGREDVDAALADYLGSFGGAAADDACARNLDWSYDVTRGELCGSTVQHRAIFAVADECGNTVRAAANLTVVDTKPPVFALRGRNPQRTEVGLAWVDPGAEVAADACHGTIDVPAAVLSPPNVTALGTYTVRYRVSDPCGQTAEATRTVVVEDTTPPVLTVHGPRLLVVRQGMVVEDTWGATATDGHDGNVSVLASAYLPDLLAQPGLRSLVYTAQDGSGNRVSALGRLVLVLPAVPARLETAEVRLRYDLGLTAPAAPLLQPGGSPYVSRAPVLRTRLYVTVDGAADAASANALVARGARRASTVAEPHVACASAMLCTVDFIGVDAAVRRALADQRGIVTVAPTSSDVVAYEAWVDNDADMSWEDLRDGVLPRLGVTEVRAGWDGNERVSGTDH